MRPNQAINQTKRSREARHTVLFEIRLTLADIVDLCRCTSTWIDSKDAKHLRTTCRMMDKGLSLRSCVAEGDESDGRAIELSD